MASSDRSRSPTTTSARNRPAFPAPRQDLPGFPKRCGPMGSAVRTLHNMMPRPQIPNRWPLLPSGPYGVLWGIGSIWKSSSTTSIDDPVGPDRHIHFHPLHQHHCLMHPYPAHSALLGYSCLASTDGPSISSTIQCPYFDTFNDYTGLQRRSKGPRVYGFDLNEKWQEDREHYDNQKINGLTLPRMIRTSAM